MTTTEKAEQVIRVAIQSCHAGDIYVSSDGSRREISRVVRPTRKMWSHARLYFRSGGSTCMNKNTIVTIIAGRNNKAQKASVQS
jgi:hypothetical protein